MVPGSSYSLNYGQLIKAVSYTFHGNYVLFGAHTPVGESLGMRLHDDYYLLVVFTHAGFYTHTGYIA